MMWHEIVFGIVIAVYVAFWIAEIWTTTPEQRKSILKEFADIVVLALVVGTFVWWLL
jgi:hypothetical protein